MKSTKNEVPSENIGFNGKTISRLLFKKRTETFDLSKNPMEHKDRKSINWKWPVQTVRIKPNKTWKKNIQIKTAVNLQDQS